MDSEFDRLAPRYENNRLSAWYKALGAQILTLLPKNRNNCVLDVGCATGWLLRQMSKNGMLKQGFGIDQSSAMVKIAENFAAEQKFTNLEFIHADWEKIEPEKLRLPDFDTVICANTMHYFLNPLQSFHRIYDCLKTGGNFFLLERNKNDSLLTLMWNFIHTHWMKRRIKFYTEDQLLHMMDKTGFSDVVVGERIKKMVWQNKLYTSSIIICGTK